MSRDIEKIIEIAKKAGEIVMKYYGNNPKISVKSDSTLVTEADFAADKYMRKELHKLFPRDKILSEETESDIKNYSGRVWMVDPLDGTRIFTLRKKGFSNIIGLCKDGVPVLGVVYAPALDILFYAETSKGAFMKDDSGIHRLRVSNISELEKSKAIIKAGKTKLGKIKIKQHDYDGGAAIKIMDVARGNIELHLEATFKASKWDVCGTQAILEEAGGRLTDLRGNNIDYMGQSSKLEWEFVASNGKIHEKVLEQVKKYL